MVKTTNAYNDMSSIRSAYTHAKRCRTSHCSICFDCRLIRIIHWNSPSDNGIFSYTCTGGYKRCSCAVILNNELGSFLSIGAKVDDLSEELLKTIELLYCK